ncbi:MAG: sulfide:quinone oxidoreductase [Pseudonocardiales bacterium]|nr:sulfide:quinone oxidoreductase [Pseudonocardiales bacterium]
MNLDLDLDDRGVGILPDMDGFAVVICGAGIAGIEGLLRLRRLAGQQVDVTLLSPDDQLVYRPFATLEPFAPGAVRRYPVEQIAADAGVHWVRDALAWVDRHQRVVHTVGGQEMPYDALLLAVGGRERSSHEHTDAFTGRDAEHTYGTVLAAVDAGDIGNLAFILPDGPTWPLPLYELALLTAQHARDGNRRLEITFVTADPRPLHAFGGDAGEAMTRLLQQAGITLYTDSSGDIPEAGHLILRPSGRELHPDRIVTLPVITGPNIRGIPGFALDRFLHVDEFCRVRDTDGRIFAAGDSTDLPVKQGGVGAQQADTAAAGIAHLAGAAEAPKPLRPVIRGMLLTGTKPLYLAAHLIAGRGWMAQILDRPPWSVDEKIVAEELAPYLERFESSGPQQSAG